MYSGQSGTMLPIVNAENIPGDVQRRAIGNAASMWVGVNGIRPFRAIASGDCYEPAAPRRTAVHDNASFVNGLMQRINSSS